MEFALWLLCVAPVLPDAGALAPSLLETRGVRTAPSASVDDARNCGSCHRDIAAQWRTSAHAFASFNNPIYRVSVERLRKERGTKASRMCAGCHDLALLTSGAMDEASISPDDVRAHAGVSCTVCHSIVHARLDGNASATLRGDPALPSRGQDTSVAAHRARVASSALRTSELCGTCHRAFLHEGTGNASAFFGMDDFGVWQQSGYAGSDAARPEDVERRDCRGCHMAREPAVLGDVAARGGTVPSHRFLGAHTTLAAMRGDDDALRRTQEFLSQSVRIDVAAARKVGGPWAWPASSLPVSAGDALEIDVVVFNEAVGHRFPGGVLDNQATRVEFEVKDARGRPLGRSDEHELRAEIVDAAGHGLAERQTHEFVAAVWNHTVLPRGARVARFAFQVPRQAELPLRFEARIVHQSRSEAMMRAACADGRTKRGEAFGVASKRLTGQVLEACVEQPKTVVARSADLQPSWARAFQHGLGLSEGLQEYLDDAVGALEFARGRAPDDSSRAQVDWALARVAGRRGQLSEALRLLGQAEVVLGLHPALAKARGEAYAQVWQWAEAARAFESAAAGAPDDVTLWQALAMAEASVGHDDAALAAAQHGLALAPRDADCLRVQALALRHLGASEKVAQAALDEALRWRTPDDGPRAKARCSAQVPGCAERRNPVPVFMVQESLDPSAGAGP